MVRKQSGKKKKKKVGAGFSEHRARKTGNSQGNAPLFHTTHQVQSMQCIVKLKETFHSDTIKQSREVNTVELYIFASYSYPSHCPLT